MRRLVAVSWACLAACGDNFAPPPDAPPPEPFRPAPHVRMPLALMHKGVVLSRVQLVTLAFSDDPAGPQLARFGEVVVGSSWYTTVGSEYGVLPVRAGRDPAPQHLTLGPAPHALSRAQLAAQIVAVAEAHRAELTSQSLYLIQVPPGVQRAPDLAGVAGYHDVVALDGQQLPFAAVLDSGDGDPAALTISAGRRLINAVSNPFAPPNDGYYVNQPMTDPWSLVFGELADLCEGEDPFVDEGVAYPRVYSNLFAVMGSAPCKPHGADETWSDVTAKPSRIQAVAPGGAFTFELTGWSTHEIPDWRIAVRAADLSAFTRDQMRPELSEDVINNGRTVTLTLHVPSGAQSGTTGGVYVLSGEHHHPWAVGFVVR